MITTTCLIGVVVCGPWPACGADPAAAAVIMTVTATAAPVATAGWMNFLVMRLPFPAPWAGDLAPAARNPWAYGISLPSVLSNSIATQAIRVNSRERIWKGFGNAGQRYAE